MKFKRKIAPEIKSRQNFITKKRLREDQINFDKLRSYRLDRVKKELEKNNLEACILFDPVNVRYALDEFVRITKPGGLICFTINEGIHEEYGFDKKIISLKENNKWKELEFFKSDYIASKDVNAWLGLYRVTKDV